MKIALFELENWQKEIAKEKFDRHDLIFFDDPLSSDNVDDVKDADVLVVFIYSKASAEIIKKMKNLKLIATMSTGYDHIDIDFCRQKGIIVCNVPAYGENTVAEHAFGLILMLSRKLYQSVRRTKADHVFSTDKSLRGIDLKGKTIGLIGCGNIGKHVARIAKGFEMRILVHDLHPDESLASSTGFSYAPFDEVLSESDFISLHVPYNKHTHHLINDEAIEKMKKDAYLINTSRGSIIDTESLVRGLESGKIAGAGLDVLEGEADVKDELHVLKEAYKKNTDFKVLLEDHVLMKMDNVVVTPHNAFNSKEALQRILDTTFNNITSFLSEDTSQENMILNKVV